MLSQDKALCLTLQLEQLTGVRLIICWICALDHLEQLVHFLLCALQNCKITPVQRVD